MTTAVNEPWCTNSTLRQEAEGYQWRNAGHGPRRTLVTALDPNAPGGFHYVRTGGLVIKRRLVLQNDMLYRFAARRYLGTGPQALLPLLNSPWWMNDDRMALLLSRARSSGSRLIDIARRQLALPEDWTDCDIIVRARLNRSTVLAAHAGPGRTASSGGSTYTIAHEAPHLFMDQIYLPGLGRHPALVGSGERNARLWFDLTTAQSFDPKARGFNP